METGCRRGKCRREVEEGEEVRVERKEREEQTAAGRRKGGERQEDGGKEGKDERRK